MRKLFNVLPNLILISISLTVSQALAQVDQAAELQSQINNRQQEIKNLEAQINQYQKDLHRISQEANSLKKEINLIDTSRKKLSTDISVTTKSIDKVALSINKLDSDISDYTTAIEDRRASLAAIIRSMSQRENTNFLELILTNDSLLTVWDEFDQFVNLQNSLQQNALALAALRSERQTARVAKTSEKTNLEGLKQKLADQKKIADQTATQKNKLLTNTKNRESNYQALLAAQLRKKQQVEAEVRQFEAELRVVIDPSKLPTGRGVLRWPLANVLITQYFGNTAFATQNPQTYRGQGRNGIDLRASIGTPVMATADGIVIGTGDTDTTCSGASYGKWVLVKHHNGLATVSGHLSLIKVSEGQAVRAGDVIAYSGNTGYSTGPHLHFTVFAGDGVTVGSPKSKVPGCGTYRMPISIGGQASYLNPLSFLP